MHVASLAALAALLVTSPVAAQVAVGGGDGQPVNLLRREAGTKVHSFSSEFGAGWVASNLVPGPEDFRPDGSPERELVWSSAGQAPFPHWVLFELPTTQWLTTFVFNNTLSEEADHPGISARLLEVHVGETPAAMRKVASFELERNTGGQAVQIAPVEARFVKFVIRTNWGHAWYTELGAGMAFDDGTRPGTLAAGLRTSGRADLYGIYFDFASAVLRPESAAAIDEIVAWHTANRARALVIEGHTDDRGGDAVNTPLSERRAAAVVAALVQKGVPAGRLTAKGLGSRAPVAPNGSEAGRARNRRVSVVLVP